MRKRSKIFFLLTVGSLVVPAALLAACGSASFNFGSTSPSGDGGVAADGSFVPPDSGVPAVNGSTSDAPLGAEDSGAVNAAPSPTTILGVHASANLFPFRLCFGDEDGGILPLPPYPDDPSQPMPETNIPGVPVGGAALLPPLLFAGGVVVPYVVSAAQLDTDISTNPAGETTCDALICSGLSPCLGTAGYFELNAVPVPSFGTMVLAIEGCSAQSFEPGSIAQCGSGYNAAAGNLSASVAALASPSGAGGLALAVAQLSPSFSQGGEATLTYADPTIDASIPVTVPPLSVSATPFAVTAVTLPLSEAGVLSAYFTLTPDSGAGLSESLAAMQFFQAPANNPTTYFNGHSVYFAAILGDVTDAAAPATLPDGAPNPAFDGHGLHVIAYPETAN